MKGLNSRERSVLEDALSSEQLSANCTTTGEGSRPYDIDEIAILDELVARGLMRWFQCATCPNLHYQTTAEGVTAMMLDEASKKEVE